MKKLSGYVVKYRKHFYCRRKERTIRAGEYLQGLFHECKSNVERMSRKHAFPTVTISNYSILSQILSGIGKL